MLFSISIPRTLKKEKQHVGDIDDDAYSNKSYSHQVGICHNDERWEYDTVNLPLYLYKIINL